MAAPKVVFLITRKAGDVQSTASGIILAADGHIATNYHALQGADSAEVRFFADPANSDDYRSFNSIKLLYADAQRDIAILKIMKINSSSLPFLQCIGNCQFRVGQKVYAIGSPRGLSNTISEGIVSALRSAGDEDLIQHTAPISPGSSGGALVDASGGLLGMNSWQVVDGQNLNFAISAKHLFEAFKKAQETKTVLGFPPETPSESSTSLEDRAWEAIFSNDYIQAKNQAERAVVSGISNSRIYPGSVDRLVLVGFRINS